MGSKYQSNRHKEVCQKTKDDPPILERQRHKQQMPLRLLQSHESSTRHLMVLSDTFSFPHSDVFLANLQELLGSLSLRLTSNDITILKYKTLLT